MTTNNGTKGNGSRNTKTAVKLTPASREAVNVFSDRFYKKHQVKLTREQAINKIICDFTSSAG